jgi:cytochrome c-type biogenesis protein CcmH
MAVYGRIGTTEAMASTDRTIYAVAAIAAAAVLASGVVLYWKLASRDAPNAVPVNPHAAGTADARAASTPTGAAPSMEVATERLALRLKQKGGTADDWALLARSYDNLKRYPEAADAFAKALELSPGDQSLIAGQAAARQAAGMAPAR